MHELLHIYMDMAAHAMYDAAAVCLHTYLYHRQTVRLYTCHLQCIRCADLQVLAHSRAENQTFLTP